MIQESSGLSYCTGLPKRALDLVVSLLVVLLLSPVYLLLALLVLVFSGRPVLFLQQRTGLGGNPFILLKFRSMRPDDDGDSLRVTAAGDRRVTRLGRLLRATKLDELPQFFNVLRGEMSIVGPRPEVPKYVAAYDARQRRVLLVRPGLTDPGTLAFRSEERLLARVPAPEREAYYLREIMPRKLEHNLKYIENAGLFRDIVLMIRTALTLVVPVHECRQSF